MQKHQAQLHVCPYNMWGSFPGTFAEKCLFNSWMLIGFSEVFLTKEWWNPTWMECSSATNPRIQTTQILGADCAVSSLEIGGLHCEPSTQSLGKTSIRMATACEKGGQETKHMGHKDWKIYKVEAVGQLAKRCRAQPCVVGAINAWVCTVCPR